MVVDTSNLQCGPDLKGDDEDDTRLLRAMYVECESYVRSFNWAPPIRRICLGWGVGGIVAVFLVSFSRVIQDGDDELWVVVGDLPSAYVVTDDASNASEALALYCDMMDQWAEAVLTRASLEHVYPVAADPTPENAKELRHRVRSVRQFAMESYAGK